MKHRDHLFPQLQPSSPAAITGERIGNSASSTMSSLAEPQNKQHSPPYLLWKMAAITRFVITSTASKTDIFYKRRQHIVISPQDRKLLAGGVI
jgi:hypothetical protein